ncbi:hypothetical protein [uncultured Winogradskyella sp.]|uniref:hypothetical protein n=1 Tax=uncultured Winogradskyella sp. TaxID=395353 RepID=UPI00260E8A25|nr:hypothetical protein [uncultured Winogradskyella sp.]
MKHFQKAVYTLVFVLSILTFFQCASIKVTSTTFEEKTPFKINSISFQEWYAGIKVGGTGINVFIPISASKNNISLKEVFFRNLRGKLIKEDGKYTSVLKNPSRLYTFKTPEKTENYPFDLLDTECVISYSENGQIKYHKITSLNEVAGTYYEDGPPSIYTSKKTSDMASLDEEDDN